MRAAMVVAAVAALGLLVGCGGDDGAEAEGDEVTFDLSEQSGSGVTGATVTLRPLAENETAVVIDFPTEGSGDEPAHPAHIHDGSCPDVGGVAFPLESISGGVSESQVDIGLDELQSGDYAVNVHKSDEEIQTYIACGDIPSD